MFLSSACDIYIYICMYVYMFVYICIWWSELDLIGFDLLLIALFYPLFLSYMLALQPLTIFRCCNPTRCRCQKFFYHSFIVIRCSLIVHEFTWSSELPSFVHFILCFGFLCLRLFFKTYFVFGRCHFWRFIDFCFVRKCCRLLWT